MIHTKPCFYKSEDDAGQVWWHVDVDIDPREQRRGMKKRSSLSSGSTLGAGNGSDEKLNGMKKGPGRLVVDLDDDENARQHDEEIEEDLDDEYSSRSFASRKRKKSN